MANINIVAVSGNLTRDPEMRATTTGTQVMTFGITVNERVRNSKTGEWEDRPNFFDVTVFGTRAEALVRILRKGLKVTVNGRLHYSSWERDGQRRSKVEIIADQIDLPPRRYTAGDEDRVSASAPSSSMPAPQAAAPIPNDLYDDDIPF